MKTIDKKAVTFSDGSIESRIFVIRGKSVMLDRDLAKFYEVETKVLKQAVRRNIERFPEDFMFELTKEELQNWRSQFVTSNHEDMMGLRYPPFAFTEQGVAMLSTVLNSKRAIQVNIEIMRTFTKLREMISSKEILNLKVADLEKRFGQHDQQIKTIFELMKKRLAEPKKAKQKIGFKQENHD